jgi:hypothetical protein
MILTLDAWLGLLEAKGSRRAEFTIGRPRPRTWSPRSLRACGSASDVCSASLANTR